ncbi:MAG: DUF3226 domain-containing protein [Armatimonadia bacterium]
MARCGDLAKPFSAEHPRVLLVEGNDEFYLLLELLGQLELNVDVRVYDGVSELAPTLMALGTGTARGFDSVTTMGVWRDADIVADDALQSVQNALRLAGFAVPNASGGFAEGQPRVGLLILPDGAAPGALENVCVASVRDPAALPCIDGYIECLQRAGVHLHPNLDKTRVHAFLASREEPGLKIGEAAKARHWDFSHPAWQPLIEFLRAM